MMRAWALAALVLGLACGKGAGDKQADKEAIEQYVNRDMAMHFSELLSARSSLRKVSADMVDQPVREHLRDSLRDRTLPLLTKFQGGAAQVKAPPAMQTLHDRAVALATETRDIVTEMVAALDVPDSPRFRAAHERLMDNAGRLDRWVSDLDQTMRDHGAQMNELPDLPAK